MTNGTSPFECVVGHSDEVDSLDAIDQVLASCKATLDGRAPVAALLNASTDYDHSVLLARIEETWPGLPLIGCTTDGEVSDDLGFLPDSVLLTLFVGDGVRASAVCSTGLTEDLEGTVAKAVGELPDEPPKLIITTFSPGSNSSEVLRSLRRHLGERACPIIGGLSADHRQFAHMSEFAGASVLTGSLPLLALYGDFHASWGVASGWFPIGADHTITKSDGHVVHEIDGKPAVELYKHYYSDLSVQSLGEYPLALYDGDGEEDFVMRAVLMNEPDSGSLHFAGEMPEGSKVRMTEVLNEGILDGSRRSVQDALANYPGNAPRLAFLFSCAARQWALGGKASEELETVRAALPSTNGDPVRIAGFYAFGEIYPDLERQTGKFHNETCVSLLLGR